MTRINHSPILKMNSYLKDTELLKVLIMIIIHLNTKAVSLSCIHWTYLLECIFSTISRMICSFWKVLHIMAVLKFLITSENTFLTYKFAKKDSVNGIFLKILWNISQQLCKNTSQRCIQNPAKHLRWSFFQN